MKKLFALLIVAAALMSSGCTVLGANEDGFVFAHGHPFPCLSNLLDDQSGDNGDQSCWVSFMP